MLPTIFHRRKPSAPRRPQRAFAPTLEHLEDRLVPAVINVNPSNYLSLVPTAQPGDTVEFAAGNYASGLNLSGMNGTAGAWITFDGSAGAVILGTPSQNTVELDNTSYLLFENFTVDSQHFNDAIKAGGGLANVAHDITIKNNTIINADSSQQTVGISTKCIAWNWTIQGNTINSAGTGMYLGDSSGYAPFINGVIENNTVENTIGYGIEIKDQEPYALVAGMPSSGMTILRYNEFLNNDIQGALGQGARPNVMIGGFPASGPGSADTYQIYGNLIDNNVSGGDYLLQVTGRATIHDNILINDPTMGGINVQAHYDDSGTLFSPQQIAIYDNTIYDVGTGISGAASWPVVGNLIFANSSGAPAGNISDSIANAGQYLTAPSTAPVAANFAPLPGQAQGPAVNLAAFASDLAYNVDYNGNARPASDAGYGAIEAAAVAQPPAAPTNLTATASTGQVVLSWSGVTGAGSYNVYRSTTTGGETIYQRNVAGTSFTDTALTNGTTYFYEVTAVNTAGESGPSSETTATALVAPVVSGISPASGPTAGGTTVTITGADFAGTTGVRFGSVAASSFTIVSNTQIRAVAPAGTAGTVDVTVTNAAGTSGTSSADRFTYTAALPVISKLSVHQGPATGGTTFTITGAHFTGATAVYFGTVPAASFTVKSDGSISVKAPAHAAGTVDIRVVTAAGTSALSAADQFTFVARPVVTSIAPKSGPTAGGTAVTITGSYLTGATKVWFGKTLASRFVVNANGTITAYAPGELAGIVDVLVVTVGGTSARTSADRFTYV